jgi:integral membrane sensor domain MASE1
MSKSFARPRSLTGWASLATICLALSFPSTALAQGKKKAEAKEPEQAYMLPYIMTTVAVLIGLAVVCMPSQRKEEVDMSEDRS